jgi:hypothetical protein
MSARLWSFIARPSGLNWLIVDDHHGAASYVAEVEWVDSNTLQIRYSSKARIFRQESRIGPIEIKYVKY